MAITANKKFWTEFIDIYHSLSSLWNTKDENYNNPVTRSYAWNKLVKKLQEVEPDANQDLVKRKINTFRSNFNREVRKIRLTQKKHSTEIYNPTLWYFDQLSFLLNKEKYNSDGHCDEATLTGLTTAKREMVGNETMYAESISQENITEKDENAHYERELQSNSILVESNGRDKVSEPEERPLSEATPSSEVLKKTLTPPLHEPITTPQVLSLPESHTEPRNGSIARTLRLKGSKLRLKSQEPYSRHQYKSNLLSSFYTDEASIYGQAWACGFRKLSPQQKIFAKKAIDEILILGQLKALKFNVVPISAHLLKDSSDEG